MFAGPFPSMFAFVCVSVCGCVCGCLSQAVSVWPWLCIDQITDQLSCGMSIFHRPTIGMHPDVHSLLITAWAAILSPIKILQFPFSPSKVSPTDVTGSRSSGRLSCLTTSLISRSISTDNPLLIDLYANVVTPYRMRSITDTLPNVNLTYFSLLRCRKILITFCTWF